MTTPRKKVHQSAREKAGPPLQPGLGQGVEREGQSTRFFPEYTGEGRIAIYRRNDKTKRLDYHGLLALEEGYEHIVAEMFGGGVYRVQLRIADVEKGGEHIGGSMDFELPGLYKPPMRTMSGMTQPPASSGTPMGSMDGSQSILNAAMVSTVVELLKASKDVKSSQPDIMAYLKPVIDMQGRMMELLLGLMTKGGGDSKKDMLDMMASMKDLLAPAQSVNPNNPHEVVKNILETIRDVREAADDLSPSRGESSDPMAILGKLAEVIVEEQQRKRGSGRTPARPATGGAPRAASSLTLVGGEEKAVTDGVDVPAWRRVLRKDGPKLIAQARAGRDPEVVAALALEFAPPNIRGVLTEFFTQETEVVGKLILEEVPALVEFPQWLTDFVLSAQERLGLLAEDGDGSSVEGGEGDDSSQGP